MTPTRTLTATLLLLAVALLPAAAGAQPSEQAIYDGPVVVDGQIFADWGEYFNYHYFRAPGKRCATPPPIEFPEGVPGDCTLSFTNPDPAYANGVVYEIPVVVHIIENTSGTGALTDEIVDSQIDVLNEDFRAIMGTNGGQGTDLLIQFKLADTDPDGNPTTGITRTVNNSWFNDDPGYWNTLSWDPNRYMNIYTNSASGALGYVPGFPQSIAGNANDRVVILYSAFGRPSPFPPFDLGRTATHEVGHYLGLYHTFQGGCAPGGAPSCYSSGDLICDTNSESSPTFGCPGSASSCGTPDPYHNYMDYSDDICFTEFTPEQALRARCTLTNYRPDVYQVVAAEIFTDGFESGDTSSWSSTVP